MFYKNRDAYCFSETKAYCEEQGLGYSTFKNWIKDNGYKLSDMTENGRQSMVLKCIEFRNRPRRDEWALSQGFTYVGFSQWCRNKKGLNLGELSQETKEKFAKEYKEYVNTPTLEQIYSMYGVNYRKVRSYVAKLGFTMSELTRQQKIRYIKEMVNA